MILKIEKPLPEHARRKIEKCDFEREDDFHVRRCTIAIPEEEAITYIEPECFDFLDVYGECELTQAIKDGTEMPVVISKFEFEKNRRSFEEEAILQGGKNEQRNILSSMQDA